MLANLLSQLGRHSEALPLMRTALAKAEAAADPAGRSQPHLVAAALGDLGSLRARMGDLDEAADLFRRSADPRPPPGSMRSQCPARCAALPARRVDAERSESRAARRSLALEQAIWGEGNRHSGDTLYNMGPRPCSRAAKRRGKAGVFPRSSIPFVPVSKGVLEELRGDAAAAARLFESASAVLRAHLGGAHPAAARAAARLARLRRGGGEL